MSGSLSTSNVQIETPPIASTSDVRDTTDRGRMLDVNDREAIPISDRGVMLDINDRGLMPITDRDMMIDINDRDVMPIPDRSVMLDVNDRALALLAKDRNNNIVRKGRGVHHRIWRYNPRYKTELCRNMNELGDCRYGDKCQFAHTQYELRPKPIHHPKYRTQKCRLYHNDAYCPYGTRCFFIHESSTPTDLEFRQGDWMPDNRSNSSALAISNQAFQSSPPGANGQFNEHFPVPGGSFRNTRRNLMNLENRKRDGHIIWRGQERGAFRIYRNGNRRNRSNQRDNSIVQRELKGTQSREANRQEESAIVNDSREENGDVKHGQGILWYTCLWGYEWFDKNDFALLNKSVESCGFEIATHQENEI